MIVLTTLNATYQHCAFGLRYLKANLGELKEHATLLEFTIAQKPRDIVEQLLKHSPRIVGFGVYIWNTTQTFEVVSILKRVRPDILVVIGGPEVSHEAQGQPLVDRADYVVQGEGEDLFRELCEVVLKRGELPATKILRGALPEIKSVALPYSLYTEEDIANRILYVEASRGCPFRCEFCLSSLDAEVRAFDLEPFLSEMDLLLNRGVKQFKFVDRTFNLNVKIGARILEFFLERVRPGLFLHFEMIPDRLPLELRELIAKFPAGTLQFEIGVQTWNEEVSRLISRRQNYEKLADNFTFLRERTGVHTHADLIVGLPGETLESFAVGFDKLAALRPNEIQVGMLKRLKGTPITRHDREYAMVYQETPPFQILSTRTMDFATLNAMDRFAKFWDLYANRGNFPNTMDLIRQISESSERGSFFWKFYEFSSFLDGRHPQRYGISLPSLVESAWYFLGEASRKPLIQDYCGTVKRDIPRFLTGEATAKLVNRSNLSSIPARQRRHCLAEPVELQ